jgi:hypothetical protein
MHLYNESTTRRSILRAQINWSRELTFSPRQINYILNRVPHVRGVYCIYAKVVSFLTSRHTAQPDSGTPWSTLEVAGWITVFALIFANKETIFSVCTLEISIWVIGSIESSTTTNSRPGLEQWRRGSSHVSNRRSLLYLPQIGVRSCSQPWIWINSFWLSHTIFAF